MTAQPAHTSGSSPGPSVDTAGVPVIDPTKNVDSLVAAASKRQEDILSLHVSYQDRLREKDTKHLEQLVEIRAIYDTQLREKESQRIDAIRAVDVGNVSRASDVASTQAQTLAAAVSASAETLRSQVAATATLAAQSLVNALEPIQKNIDELRKAQYEQQGQKVAQTEKSDVNQWIIGIAIGLIVATVNIILHFIK